LEIKWSRLRFKKLNKIFLPNKTIIMQKSRKPISKIPEHSKPKSTSWRSFARQTRLKSGSPESETNLIHPRVVVDSQRATIAIGPQLAKCFIVEKGRIKFPSTQSGHSRDSRGNLSPVKSNPNPCCSGKYFQPLRRSTL
jgi:hypothetical protein